MRSRGTLWVAITPAACTTCQAGQVSAQGVTESATGSAHWTIELPNLFDVVVGLSTGEAYRELRESCPGPLRALA